jgi:predicted ATPase
MNLLTGINGRGKSTLLQSLLLCKQTAEEGKLDNQLWLAGDLVRLGNYGNIRHADSISREDIVLEFDYETDQAYKRLSYRIRSSEKDGYETVAVIIKSTFGDISYDYPIAHQQIQDMEALKLLPQFSPLPFKNIIFVPADRLGPQEYYQADIGRDGINFGRQAIYAVNTLLKHRKKLVHEQLVLGEDAKTLETQTGEWISDILMAPKTMITLDDSNPHIITLSFQTGRSSNQFTPPNMGFAFSYLLPVVIGGLLAEAGDVLIIENPEAHLHAKAQSKLTQFCIKVANTGVQVILESHSEHVLNGLRIAAKEGTLPAENMNVLYFRNDTASPCIGLPIDKNGDIDLWPDGFFDQYDEDLKQLLGF